MARAASAIKPVTREVPTFLRSCLPARGWVLIRIGGMGFFTDYKCSVSWCWSLVHLHTRDGATIYLDPFPFKLFSCQLVENFLIRRFLLLFNHCFPYQHPDITNPGSYR